MGEELRFFVAGGQGFIGSWIIEHLCNDIKPAKIILMDLKPDDSIVDQIVSPENKKRVERLYGDVTNTKWIVEEIVKANPTHIITLAALQIPTCKVNPVLGATVNVVGLINVFEAAKVLKEKTGKAPKVVFASSGAVAGPESDYTPNETIKDTAPHLPNTHYGVFKVANEGNARVYWLDHGISSVCLRPMTVYGVGREIGLTSSPTKALKSVILGRPFKMTFKGYTGFNYVEDVADVFIHCALNKREGAYALNCRCETYAVEDFIKVINQTLPEAEKLISIDANAPTIPIAYNFDWNGLKELLSPKEIPFTPIVHAIPKIAKQFISLKERGLLHARDLPS